MHSMKNKKFMTECVEIRSYPLFVFVVIVVVVIVVVADHSV